MIGKLCPVGSTVYTWDLGARTMGVGVRCSVLTKIKDRNLKI